MYIYYFKVSYYDEGEHQECGYIQARNYPEAVNQVVGYYGEELMSIFIEEWDVPFIRIPAEMAEAINEYNI